LHTAEQEMPRDPRDIHADPLALFGAEPVPPHDASRRDASPDPLALFGAEPESPQAGNEDEIDTLILAVAADGPAATVAEQPAAITPPAPAVQRRPRVHSGSLFQPAVLRWTAATFAAFVVGAVIAQWGFRLPERGASPVSPASPVSTVTNVEPEKSVVRTPPNKTATDLPMPSRAVAEADSASRPRDTVRSTIPRPDDVAAVPAPTDNPLVAANATEREIHIPAPAEPTRAEPSAGAGATDVTPAPAPVAARPFDSMPAPAVSSALSPVGETVSPPPPVPPPVSEVVPPRPVPVHAAMETAVRGALQQYAAAYGEMNVMATAEVWPSVDRRALAHAFATLKSQAVAFDSCDVRLTESTATVRCLGTVHFVRKVGNPTPRSEHQQWLFTMGKVGSEWKIERVVASQVSTTTPSRAAGDPERGYRH
jgi:hypothetical protein